MVCRPSFVPLRNRICEFSCCILSSSFFFFNDTATTEIYTLSLHDALPILSKKVTPRSTAVRITFMACRFSVAGPYARSEEHTSELQSQSNLVCRLLLEKKKKKCCIRHTLVGRLHIRHN